MIIAETDRLVLRKLEPSDASELFRIYSDPVVMRYMSSSSVSIEQEEESLRRHIENYYDQLGYGLWAVMLKSSHKLIGRCGLMQYVLNGEKEVEISYLLEQESWGKGYAKEASLAVIDFAFKKLNIGRLIAVIHPENTASVNLAKGLGFSLGGNVEYKSYGLVDLYTKQDTSS